MRIVKILFLLFCLLPCSLQAATYYMATDGDDGADGSIGSPWRTFNKPNTTLQSGDTLYVRGGTYNIGDSATGTDPQGIAPSNSGADAAHVITYVAYTGETVTVNGTHNRSRGVYLNGKSYIKVSGIIFSNLHWYAIINGGGHNEIGNCTFGPERYRTDSVGPDYRPFWIYNSSTHNWIHDNTIYGYGSFDETDQYGTVLEIGYGTAHDPADASHYNTIENNQLYQSGHHVLGPNTRYNVVRGNNVHNEPWYESAACAALYGSETTCNVGGECPAYLKAGKCGYRVVSLTGADDVSGYNLLEGNRIAYGGPEVHPTMIGGSGLTVGTSYNIVRYNSLYANDIYGLRFGSSLGGANYNSVYNNTFYHNGYGPDTDANLSDYPHYRCAMYFDVSDANAPTILHDNVVKNNLFHNNSNVTRGGDTPIHVSAAVAALQTIANNCEECTADPKFVNTDITNPASTTSPNLALTASSPAAVLDAGSALTTTSGTGSSETALVLSSGGARYFQDGTWGSELAANNQADWVCVGTVTNCAQIASINYGTDTLTLSSPLTWGADASVWLYKNSSGTQVLYGSAPDIGAHEYGQGTPSITIGAGGSITIGAGGSITLQ